MKTIVRDNLSVFLLDDSEVVNVTNDFTIIGNPQTMLVSDCKKINTKVYENIQVPEDWKGCKYFFDGVNWEKNPNYVEPPVEIIQPQPVSEGTQTL